MAGSPGTLQPGPASNPPDVQGAQGFVRIAPVNRGGYAYEASVSRSLSIVSV